MKDVIYVVSILGLCLSGLLGLKEDVKLRTELLELRLRLDNKPGCHCNHANHIAQLQDDVHAMNTSMERLQKGLNWNDEVIFERLKKHDGQLSSFKPCPCQLKHK